MKRSHTTRALGIAAIIGAAFAGDVKPAKACGGCFGPPTEVTVVNEHRMVLSISKTQTVLWDQIKYSGGASEFAWVLPVKPGTKIQLSHDEFIAALDSYTQPVITGPTPTPSSGPAFSCGSAEYAAASFDSASAGGTTIVSQQVVGPYEAVTLHASTGDSLEAWLTAHHYNLPENIKPIVGAYVKEQFDFIALRLLPGKDVAAMQPVRVVTQGADPTLPLRMVAAGVGERVGMLLYVIGEGRYEAPQFYNGVIRDAQLTWDASAQKSNYSELSEAFMTSGPKPGVLTEFAGHAFTRDFVNPNGGGFSGGFGAAPVQGCQSNGGGVEENYACAIASAALASGRACKDEPGVQDGGLAPYDAALPPPIEDAGAATDASSDAASSADASDDAAATDASTADAQATDAGASGDAGPGSFDRCIFDDLDVATAYMPKKDVWITRMRMHLPVSALAADLKLGASSPQALVTPYHDASAAADSGGCSTSGSGTNTSIGVVLGALGLTLLVRRRRPRA